MHPSCWQREQHPLHAWNIRHRQSIVISKWWHEWWHVWRWVSIGVRSLYPSGGPELSRGREQESRCRPQEREWAGYSCPNRNLFSSCLQQGKVLRILKVERQASKVSQHVLPDETTVESEAASLVELVRFHKDVMSRILNKAFLQIPTFVRLRSPQLSDIHNITEPHRPKHRMTKRVPVRDTIALLMPDYCVIPNRYRNHLSFKGPVISVEIKPKQGFLEASPSQLNIAPFCLKQFQKVCPEHEHHDHHTWPMITNLLKFMKYSWNKEV